MKRWTNLIGWISVLALCGAIACIFADRGIASVILFLVAGILGGIIVPHSDSDTGSTHGASDSNG